MKPARARRGSDAVEFALLLPVMIALTAGLVDYAWFYNQQLAVIDAARAGGRAGAATAHDATNSACQIAEAVTLVAIADAGISGVDGGNVFVAVVADGPDGNNDDDPDTMLYIDVSFPYVPLMGLVVSPSEAHGSVVMRLEDQDSVPCGPL